MVSWQRFMLLKSIITDAYIAIVIRTFLHNTQSQLTYNGLFSLASLLQPGSLVALFRNSHLSVLYKSEGEEPMLYTLVTDSVFLQEPSVVWERLEDVDGGWACFVDSDFVRSSPAGGDFAGQTAEATLRAIEPDTRAIDPAECVISPTDTNRMHFLTLVWFDFFVLK